MARLALISVLVALLLPTTAQATYESTVSGGVATMTGNSASDTLILEASGPNWAHNRDADAGFDGPTDFNTAAVGPQTVPRTQPVVVNAGGGVDTLILKWVEFSGTVTYNGGSGADYAQQWAPVPGGPLTVKVGPGASVTGVTEGTFVANSENLFLLPASETDAHRFEVAGPTPFSLSVEGQSGDDTLVLADSVSPLLSSANFYGGNDTLDFSAWTRTVVADLAEIEWFSAFPVNGAKEVPPNASPASGSVSVMLDTVTGSYGLFGSVSGLDVGDITGTHLHRAPAGVDGPIIADHTAETWTGTPPSGSLSAGPFQFPPEHLPALRAGEIYVNIHTTAYPDGEIRGQLVHDQWTGRASGVGLAGQTENVLGGSGDDVLIGSGEANRFRGGAGEDTLTGLGGGDDLDGESGADSLSGGDGGDALVSTDGGAVDRLRCGPGADSVTADDVDVVDTDCETVTRVVTLPPATSPAPPVVTPPMTSGPALTNASFLQALYFDLLGRRLRARAVLPVRRDGRVALLSLNCRAKTPCTGRHRVLVRRKAIGSASVRVPAGEARLVVVRLTKAGLRKLRRGHRTAVRLELRVSDGDGHSRTNRRAVTLRRR